MSADPSSRVSALKEVLRKHFQSLDDSAAFKLANDLERKYSVARGIESILNSDREPTKDKEDIEAAAKSIRRAAKRLAGVGGHGGKAFPEVLRCFFPDNPEAQVYPSATTLAQDRLVESLMTMAEILDSAAASVNTEALPIISAFDESADCTEYINTKPKKIAASEFADECGVVFYEQTGCLPKVRTEFGSGSAYGPFLEFVADAFEACGVEASPETWARSASKDFSQKN